MGTFVPPGSAQRAVPSSAFQAWREELTADAEEWATGRSWLVRLPLLLYLAYGFVRHLFDPLYGTFLFGGITLGIHELGHVIFSFLPALLVSAAGSFAQLAAPIATVFIFLRQRDYFGISVAFAWLSFSLFNLATYIADARDRELPLVTVGSGEAKHDWHYILKTLGLLGADDAIAMLTRVVAFAAGIAALALGSWLLVVMFRTRKATAPIG